MMKNHLRTIKRMLTGRITYNEDGLCTEHNSDFKHEADFIRSYSSGLALELEAQKDMMWRLHTLCWAGKHAKQLGGDFVECGVFKGFSSFVVADYLDFQDMDASFYLLDTFKDFGRMKPCLEYAKAAFSKYPNVHFVVGSIPETLPQVKSERIAYLHIDLNAAEPETSALGYFWDRMMRGGVIILDDYGFPGHKEQKHAHDRFFIGKGRTVLTLPTGQGMVIK